MRKSALHALCGVVWIVLMLGTAASLHGTIIRNSFIQFSFTAGVAPFPPKGGLTIAYDDFNAYTVVEDTQFEELDWIIGRYEYGVFKSPFSSRVTGQITHWLRDKSYVLFDLTFSSQSDGSFIASYYPLGSTTPTTGSGTFSIKPPYRHIALTAGKEFVTGISIANFLLTASGRYVLFHNHGMLHGWYKVSSGVGSETFEFVPSVGDEPFTLQLTYSKVDSGSYTMQGNTYGGTAFLDGLFFILQPYAPAALAQVGKDAQHVSTVIDYGYYTAFYPYRNPDGARFTVRWKFDKSWAVQRDEALFDYYRGNFTFDAVRQDIGWDGMWVHGTTLPPGHESGTYRYVPATSTATIIIDGAPSQVLLMFTGPGRGYQLGHFAPPQYVSEPVTPHFVLASFTLDWVDPEQPPPPAEPPVDPIDPPPSEPPVTSGSISRIVNLSVMTGLNGSGETCTVGFVVGAGAASPGDRLDVLVRTVGPSLRAFGVADPAGDPMLTLVRGSSTIAANDNWGVPIGSGAVGPGALEAAFQRTGAFAYPSRESLDSALLVAVEPGSQSAVASTKSGTAGGRILTEIYDATPRDEWTLSPRLRNVSVLKDVGALLTAGFVIGGDSQKKVLIRAAGPSLAAFGVSAPLANPRLTVFNGSQPVASNDDWQTQSGPIAGTAAAVQAAFGSTGAFAFPAGSKDAAILLTLPPANYSVQVTGPTGSPSGPALIEVYEVE